MRILGLDLSLRSTGYVLLDEDQVVWHGCVGSDTVREAERLLMFDDWIRDALWKPAMPDPNSRMIRRVDQVGVEGYSYGSPSAKTQAFSLGELGGVIKLAIHQAGIPLHIIPPGTWKKALCGNGSLDKTKSALEIYKRYGVEFARQDVLDAWAVAMCLRRQLLGLDKPEPKSRRRRTALPQTSLNLDPATA